MHMTMPKPIIKCSKCESIDVVIPERSANATYEPEVLLRCRKCGHEKRAEHKQRFDDLLTRSVGTTSPWPKTETF